MHFTVWVTLSTYRFSTSTERYFILVQLRGKVYPRCLPAQLLHCLEVWNLVFLSKLLIAKLKFLISISRSYLHTAELYWYALVCFPRTKVLVVFFLAPPAISGMTYQHSSTVCRYPFAYPFADPMTSMLVPHPASLPFQLAWVANDHHAQTARKSCHWALIICSNFPAGFFLFFF